MKGKLITFEGCEGSGKSTQIRLLTEKLKNLGVGFLLAREPGGTRISEAIRATILDPALTEMSAECEALLYAAARAQLLKEVVIPALDEGKTVLLDRYIDSSLAYQAFARGLGFDFVRKINDFAFNNALPDCTVFLDLDPVSAFGRKGGADVGDRLEIAGAEFHRKVYEGYKKLAKIYPDRIVAVDCGGTKAETHEKIMSALKEKGCLS